MKTDRDRIHIVKKGNVAAATTETDLSAVVPASKSWHIKRITFGDESINDGLSGFFEVDWGIGATREVLSQGFLMGNTFVFLIDRSFQGDGSKLFRFKRTNPSASAKKMFLMIEGFKREGDL